MHNCFQGFSPLALSFFEELAANNNKVWFAANRADFETLLLEPLKQLVADLGEAMLKIDPELLIIPAVDRTIARIHRDIRFARDKSPYKTHLWVSFKRPSPEWKDRPCFFFEIAADRYRYGMGYYSASKRTMDTLRRFIEDEPELFRQAIAQLPREQFAVEGESYQRLINPAVADDLQAWHRRRNLYLVCNRLPDARLFSRGILDELARGFEQLAPFYRLLWGLG
jgi:uncharacterized protein (TIGR02453 family)